jgi:hypothetical protein
MTLRSYARSFFTREYWETLGSLLFGIAFARRAIREQLWKRAECETDSTPAEAPE